MREAANRLNLGEAASCFDCVFSFLGARLSQLPLLWAHLRYAASLQAFKSLMVLSAIVKFC